MSQQKIGFDPTERIAARILDMAASKVVPDWIQIGTVLAVDAIAENSAGETLRSVRAFLVDTLKGPADGVQITLAAVTRRDGKGYATHLQKRHLRILPQSVFAVVLGFATELAANADSRGHRSKARAPIGFTARH